jgi:energy-coupling factor transporter ATP-binding protein EcfA2
MDEPFGALDALTREQMRLDLEALWLATRKTVLFITHSIDEAVLLADRVVVMSPRPGRIERVFEPALPRPRGLEARPVARVHRHGPGHHRHLPRARRAARRRPARTRLMTTLTARGIVAAPFLPMHPDESIDFGSLAPYLAWIAKQKPTAIAMNMDASEGPALDRDEQLAVLETSKRAIGGACPLVSGLIAGSTRDAVKWGRELAAAGAQALAIFPPFPTFLGKPVPGEMIERYHRAIADGVGLPMFAFQFPVAWGPDFPPDTLARLAAIPQIVGLKEASFDTTKTVETIDTRARCRASSGS